LAPWPPPKGWDVGIGGGEPLRQRPHSYPTPTRERASHAGNGPRPTGRRAHTPASATARRGAGDVALGPLALPAALIVLSITRIIVDVVTEAYGYRVARWVIWTDFAGNLLAILADEAVGLDCLQETPTGEVRSYPPEADAHSHAGKIGCLTLTITRNADPRGGGGIPPSKTRPRRGYMYYSARIPPGGMHTPLYPRGV
jgi:hypothetical protein